jgi:hypothetical protein
MTIGVLGNNDTLTDATLEACEYIGHVFTADGASHTIDTTGSSSLGWMTGAVTFANAGSSFTVGLGTVDLANGPPARATNVANAVTFSVSKTLTGGGGGITATAWQEHVPDAGTMTIANGDLVAFSAQMVVRAGADVVNVRKQSITSTLNSPNVTNFVGGAYAEVAATPNMVITFSDGVLGYFIGSIIGTVRLATAWNNLSATKEYGNFFQFPGPVSVAGIGVFLDETAGANFSLNLYSAPLVAPVQEKTIAFDANVKTSNAFRWIYGLFPSPFALAANTPVVGAIQPTTNNNVTLLGMTMNAAAHQSSHVLAANCYAVNRGTVGVGTPFAAQNSNKDIIHLALLLSGLDNGATPGVMGARIFSGF